MTTKVPAELSSTPSIVDNGDATAITIDSSERVGINTSSPAKKLHITDTSGNHIRVAYSDGYYWDVGRQSADGRLSFTDVTGGETLALRTGGGITFNGDTAAANALDDYEEGTVDWYTLTDGTATWTQSQSGNRYASYTKIGNQVHVHGNIFNGSISGSQAGPVRVPLPYTNANTSSGQNRAVGIAAVYNGSSAYTGDYTLLKVEAGASYGEIVSGGNNGQWGTVTLPTNGTIIIDIFYTAA